MPAKWRELVTIVLVPPSASTPKRTAPQPLGVYVRI